MTERIRTYEDQAESREMVLNSIMTAEEYAEIRHDTPYIYVLRAGEKELHYFGSPHTNDPDGPVFSEIEKLFLQAKPEAVFVEGISVDQKPRYEEIIKSLTRREVIEKFGEPGFTVKLATEQGIEWDCPEPTYENLFQNLLERGFSKEEIFVWYVLRALNQYKSKKVRNGFEKYVSNYMTSFKIATNWSDFDYSFGHLMNLVEKIIGEEIDVENVKQNYVCPVPFEENKQNETVLNKVATASTLIRDRKIVGDIAEALKKYNKVFVVYGASHAVMEEPALKKFFESIS